MFLACNIQSRELALTKFEANLCSGLRVEVEKAKKFMTTTKMGTGWSLVTLTHGG